MTKNKEEEIGFCNLCGVSIPYSSLILAKCYALNPKFFDTLYVCSEDYEILKNQNLLFLEKTKSNNLNDLINWVCFKKKELKVLSVTKKTFHNSVLILIELRKKNSPLSFLELSEIDSKIGYSGVIGLIKILYSFGLVFKGRLNRTIYVKLNPDFEDKYIQQIGRVRKKKKNKKRKNKKRLLKNNFLNKQLLLFPDFNIPIKKKNYVFHKVIKKHSFEQLQLF